MGVHSTSDKEWKLKCFNYHAWQTGQHGAEKIVDNKWHDLDITIDLKVLPCCAYHSKCSEGPTGDPYLDNLPSDWNDLKKHTLEEILNHEVFTEYLTDKNWQDPETCPSFCASVCGEYIKEKT